MIEEPLSSNLELVDVGAEQVVHGRIGPHRQVIHPPHFGTPPTKAKNKKCRSQRTSSEKRASDDGDRSVTVVDDGEREEQRAGYSFVRFSEGLSWCGNPAKVRILNRFLLLTVELSVLRLHANSPMKEALCTWRLWLGRRPLVQQGALFT